MRRLLNGTKRGVRGAMRKEEMLANDLVLIFIQYILLRRITQGHTMTSTIIEEHLWYFCGLCWNADDVAISTAGTAALEGTLALHSNECGRDGLKIGRIGRF